MIRHISDLNTDFCHPHLIHVDDNWCNDPKNKYSSSKWKKLAIDLYKSGFRVIYRGGTSIYLSVLSKEKMIKVRVSNHKPTFPKQPEKKRNFNKKFGNVGLIVGPNGVSTKEAFELITQTLG